MNSNRPGGRGRGRRHGRGRGFRGGRPPVQPIVKQIWELSEGEYILELTNVELEVLKLIDHDNLTQEEAALSMNVSRGTVWRILQNARNNVINALISGAKNIKITLKETKNE